MKGTAKAVMKVEISRTGDVKRDQSAQIQRAVSQAITMMFPVGYLELNNDI